MSSSSGTSKDPACIVSHEHYLQKVHDKTLSKFERSSASSSAIPITLDCGSNCEVRYNSYRICDAAVGMKAFFDMLHQKPHKLILFGATCTGVTDPIAKSSQFFQLAQPLYRGLSYIKAEY
ncbi:hypothetical protein TNCV_2168591 [Trichonephila clavipes]|nr:hypothetical protein TNCV_2168591 [Trichonephila clavipes]